MPEFTSIILGVLFLVLSLVTTFLNKQNHEKRSQQPPRLGETIPYVSNIWQYMTNNRLFMTRVRQILKDTPIAQCQLGPMNTYLVTGNSNVSLIFRSSFTSEPWILRILENAGGYTSTDMAHYYADGSGATSRPRRGPSELLPPEKRIWHTSHRMHDDTLIHARPINAFATSFQGFFAQELEAFPADEWVENIQIFSFLKSNMTAAATRAVVGPRIMDQNPDFIDAFWQYEKTPATLAFGLPPWINRRAVRIRDRFGAMCREWYELADRDFDWTGPDRQADWEPNFGSQVSKGLALWAKSFAFSSQSIGGAFALLLSGLHSNVIPICGWVMFELLQNPELYLAVKEEISEAEITNQASKVYFDHQKLTSLPLLQSVFTEVMRLHVSVLITRTSTENITIAGYTLPKGSIVQAPTEVAHLDESTWGKPGHPASEFWGYRHVKEIETTDETGNVVNKLEFFMSGKTGSFFPYGGGISICAGRFIANAEVLLAVSMLISRFDIEFVEWVKLDGSFSERAAIDDIRYANAVAKPPDRDMKVRWRRLW
ncbi:hypothetical protein Daesc_000110 [Daldinia eschscholtzii]|uniref:Cytochrome P450 n=1 Tax=Daldinia eschscholtzii TaxID=292717 RepID=A0AAX6MY49_9PEZI